MSTQDNRGWICSVCGASNNPHQLLCAANCWKGVGTQNKLTMQGVCIPPIEQIMGQVGGVEEMHRQASKTFEGGYASRPE